MYASLSNMELLPYRSYFFHGQIDFFLVVCNQTDRLLSYSKGQSMIDNFALLWFSLIFFFLFLEMGHPGLLYFLSFSCGALCSFIATLYGLCVPSQLLIFLAGTCGAVLIVHVWIKQKKNQLQTPSHRSNMDALIGKKVIIFAAKQQDNIWQAQISGQIWQVRAVCDEQLHEGQQVVIVDVQGCHLRVDSIK